MRKPKRIRNMQRRRKTLGPQQKTPRPSSPRLNSAQVTEFMSKAESEVTFSSSQTCYFVHGPTGLHNQQEPDGTWRLPLQDGLSSIRSVTDDALSILESREYDPFGNLVDTQGISQMPFGFTGEMTDDDGLVYLRNRYYNPVLGVFPSPDPVPENIHQPMSLNPYSYVQNNPVNWVDPSGNVTIPNPWDKCDLPAPQGPKRCPLNSWTSDIGECCFLYNRHTARDYAIRHAPAGQSHPAFCDHPATCSGGTDCANFVSQAMRAGGHPMHYLRGIEAFVQTPVTSANTGWACRSTEGDPTHCVGSQTWRGAIALADYIDSFGLSSVEDTFVPSPNSENSETWQAIIDLARNIHQAGIGVGDVLYIPTGPDKQHVALIVGWGLPLKAWDELLNNPVSTSYNYIEGSVPYIVDHGTQRSIADQSSGRPYYFLNWAPGIQEVTKWVFKEVPDVVCEPSNDVITFEEAMTRIERE